MLCRHGVVLCLMLGVVGCRDSLSPSTIDANSRPSLAVTVLPDTGSSDMPMTPRFSIAVKPAGPFRPKSPITLNVTVTALLPTAAMEVSITLPDVALEEQRRANGGRLNPAQRLRAQRRETHRALATQQRVTTQETVMFPEAGYYQVIVRVDQRSDEPVTHEGRWVPTSSFREVWLWVSEDGGATSELFDATLLPDSVAPEPGVRRVLSRAAAQRSYAQTSNGGEAAQPAQNQLGAISGGARSALNGISPPRQVLYLNQDVGNYEPVVGAIVQWQIVDAFNTVTQSFQGITDANGMYDGPCVTLPGFEYARVTYTLESPDVRVNGYTGSWIDDSCDPSVRYSFISGTYGWIFSRFSQFIPFSRSLLNVSRGQIDVSYDASAPADKTAYYTPVNLFTVGDRITMVPSSIGLDYGRFTVAHEYGHAIHEKALSGNATSGQCPSQHFLQGFYNLACAFSEGFADFVGATSENVWSTGRFYRGIVNYTNGEFYVSGGDGAVQEAAVAALLYDLTDSPGGDNGASEPWDQTLGERVAATIRDCRVRVGSSSPTRVRGVDDFIYCAERTIDPNIKSLFFSRPYFARATSIWANASASQFWQQSAVRAVWRKNLFNFN
jgi:hypothetical protein